MRRALAMVGLAALSVTPAWVAGMDTVRIVIKGEQLSAPVEIVDPRIVGLFHVGAGPGNFRRMPDGTEQPSYAPQCFVVDWSRGIVDPPKGLQLYEVSFVTTRTNPGTYRVSYALDQSTGEGYVYIPGERDSAYKDNVWLISRGIEGNWFRAWSAWERVANPLILKSSKVR